METSTTEKTAQVNRAVIQFTWLDGKFDWRTTREWIRNSTGTHWNSVNDRIQLTSAKPSWLKKKKKYNNLKKTIKKNKKNQGKS